MFHIKNINVLFKAQYTLDKILCNCSFSENIIKLNFIDFKFRANKYINKVCVFNNAVNCQF